MIFVTVGTTKFPFDRPLKATDEAMIGLDRKEKLVVQAGKSDYKFKYEDTEIFEEIPFGKMSAYFKKAKIVVTHGGPATIFLSLKYSKNKPLVVPRSKRFNEHVDNHQIFFTKFLKKKGLIKTVFPDESLIAVVGDYLKFPEKLPFKKRSSGSKKLVEKLIKYTESIK